MLKTNLEKKTHNEKQDKFDYIHIKVMFNAWTTKNFQKQAFIGTPTEKRKRGRCMKNLTKGIEESFEPNNK